MKRKNVLAALLTALLAIVLGITCNAQPGGSIEFTRPPVFDEASETSKRTFIEPVNFAIRREGMVAYITFFTAKGEEVKAPFLFAYWTAANTYYRKLVLFADAINRGYPMLAFTLQIDCIPQTDYFNFTKVTNAHD